MAIHLLLSLALAVGRADAGGVPTDDGSSAGGTVPFRLPPPQLPPTTSIEVLRLGVNASVGVNATAGADDDSGDCRSNATADDDGATDEDELVAELLEWLVENGAYINPKLDVRRLVPGDPSSPRGIYAAEDLEADETVCQIPWELIVKPSDTNRLAGLAEGLDLDCGTIRAVADAISEGTTPYGRYLAAQPRDYTPMFWSDAARKLLQDVLATGRDEPLTGYGDELPPHGADDHLEEEVGGACGVDVRDPTVRHAAMLVKARADYDLLVPFYDMTNHHNGKQNVKHLHDPYTDEPSDAGGYEIVTTQRIRAGEQVYNSYNRCSVCSGHYDLIGTPEMFFVYGFVEPHPQRWLFDFARVKFDLDWRDGNASTGELEVDFHVPPSRRGMDLLGAELERLDAYAAANRTADHAGAGVSAGEWESLWRYHDALRDALVHAVRSDAELVDDVWEMDDDWWVRDGTLTSADDEAETWVWPTINA